MRKLTLLTIVLSISLVACVSAIPGGVSTAIVMTAEVSTVVAETPGPPATAGPSPTPIPATSIPTLPASGLSPTELKYKILEQFPDFFFCDPDYYPVARDDELSLAQVRFPELQANQEEFQAILDHNNLSGATTFSDDQKLLVYREHKKFNAIRFELIGDRYQFRIQIGQEGQQGSAVAGTIDGSGAIDVQNQESSIPACPICLAAGTLIGTPRGAVSVEDLRVGDSVWTMNEAGERISVTILKTSHVPVPSNHQVVHVVLSDGRELWASHNHPTADGRVLDDLEIDDILDGAHVVLVERLPYHASTTYDILPSGETGFYWANGILIDSTLVQHR